MRRGLVGFGVAGSLVLGLCAAAQASSGPAIARIAKQFDKHPLIMMGELHRYGQLHVFLREMIRDPQFICRVDDVVVEFGNSRLQELADAYASGGNVTETQLQSVWRETAVPLTWNSPVYRKFYQAIRDINKQHLCPHPIRIVLGDPPLDWSKIKSAKDYEPFTDRDGHFANVVEREVLSRHHRAFLLAGLAHAVKRTPQGAEGDLDEPDAAQLIGRKHPGLLFCIVPVPSAAAAKAMRRGPPPSFRVVRGSELEHADFGMIWNLDKKWPPMKDIVDGVLYLVPDKTLLYPSPKIYLDPAYQQELLRRVSIIKDHSGQDFMPVLDDLVKEAAKEAKSHE